MSVCVCESLARAFANARALRAKAGARSEVLKANEGPLEAEAKLSRAAHASHFSSPAIPNPAKSNDSSFFELARSLGKIEINLMP